MKDIDTRIARVIARDACSGCGACTLLDDGLRMRLNAQGYLRPVRESPPSTPGADTRVFSQVCPGVRVAAPKPAAAQVHPLLGPCVQAWQAWASDPEIRRQGSSGGALTALASWLVETGQAFAVTGAGAAADPRRTVPVTIMSREQALQAAGSRYAPVAAAGNPDAVTSSAVAVGKPCEVSALRGLTSAGAAAGDPLLLSFFCAGTPSSHSTDTLVGQLGFAEGAVPDELWYRGRGWPGEFTVRLGDQSASMSYDESWGKVLGRTTQWRCKVCVDGTGEQADIVAGDSWHSDERGYPLFDDGDGISALIARTMRGQQIVHAAIAAGVLTATPMDIEQLVGIQPLQVERRRFLLARMIGSLLAGRRPPRYPGYGVTLLKFLLAHPRQSLRIARGTWRRVRSVSKS